MSIKMVYTYIRTASSKQYAIYCHTVINELTYVHPGQNPYRPSYNQSFLSHSCLIYPAITCSSCLQTIEVKLRGLYFETADRPPLCVIGNSVVFFQSHGMVALFNDIPSSLARYGGMTSPPDFRISPGIHLALLIYFSRFLLFF